MTKKVRGAVGAPGRGPAVQGASTCLPPGKPGRLHREGTAGAAGHPSAVVLATAAMAARAQH